MFGSSGTEGWFEVQTATAQWERVGRGRDISFFCTAEEVQWWLNHALPAKFEPYVILGAVKVKQGRYYVDEAFQFKPEEFLAERLGPEGNRWSFSIVSTRLTPNPTFGPKTSVDSTCSLNGLVELQHGLTHKGRECASSIGMVDVIRSRRTGKVVKHDAYLQVYLALARVVRKALCYSTIRTFPDGSENERTDMELMTCGAVEAYERGYRFACRPGRRLK